MRALSNVRPAVGQVLAIAILAAAPLVSASAGDAPPALEATYNDIERTIGAVPTFIRQLPAAALPGAWMELKDLEFSETTALPAKTKALISLAVAAQIPCTYCVWADTNAARQSGATEEEIAEAVAVAAVTRHWSTLFNGLQVDFELFKSELGGEVAANE